MHALSGQSFDRYQLQEPLGEGGMATVYRAFDTRLERAVALKVIRTDYHDDPLFLKRFEREARALAQLNHPHIVQVLDVGEHQGIPFVVMEYLGGGTLKARIGRPLLPREAGALLAPIARALAYAHDLGIIHRDVKPANILLTPEGTPKLSDFGIAKILERPGTTELTATGVGVGTPDYMAPEQWLGQVSPQSDIYALGVVLYELLAGRRPYAADTPVAVLLKHVNDPLPSPRLFAPDLPDAVEQVLLKALAKKPEARYASMAAFADALEGLQHVRLARPGLARPWLWLGVGTVGLATLGLGCLGLWAALGAGTDAQPTAAVVAVERRTPTATDEPTRGPERLATTPAVETAAVSTPAAAAATSGADATVDARSASAVPTPLVEGASGASLSAGRIAFYSLRDGNFEIYTIDPDGGNPLNLTRDLALDWLPAWSPDGTRIAFVSDRDGNEEIYTMNADGSDLIRLTHDAGVDRGPAFSPDGQRIAFYSERSGTGVIYLMNADGSGATPLTADATQSELPKWSPDGRQILFQSRRDGDWDVYVMNADGSGLRNLTHNAVVDTSPDWSPDGREIVFASNRDSDHYEVYVMSADGLDARRVTQGAANCWTPAWSADGSYLYAACKMESVYQLVRVRSDGRDLQRLTSSEGHDQAPDSQPLR